MSFLQSRLSLYLFITCIAFLSITCSDENKNPDSSVNRNEHNENTESSYSQNKYPDGTYSATVDYHNPETGYSATYTLDVEVQNNEIVEIDFPKGGYLDEDHISPAELDDDGHAEVDGEEGRTYDVQIDT